MPSKRSDSAAPDFAPEPQTTPTDLSGFDESTVDAALAPPVSGDIQPGASETIDTMIGWAFQQMQAQDDDPAEAMAQIVAGEMLKGSADDVLSGGTATHARDVLGVNLWVKRVTWQESDGFGDDSCPIYAVFHCRRGDTQADDVVTCGGWRIVAQAVRLTQLGAWPRVVAIVNARKNAKDGKMPLKLSLPV